MLTLTTHTCSKSMENTVLYIYHVLSGEREAQKRKSNAKSWVTRAQYTVKHHGGHCRQNGAGRVGKRSNYVASIWELLYYWAPAGAWREEASGLTGAEDSHGCLRHGGDNLDQVCWDGRLGRWQEGGPDSTDLSNRQQGLRKSDV